MNKKLISVAMLAFFVATLLSFPVRANPYCINSTWIGDNFTFDGTTHNMAEQCTYGCDTKTSQCMTSQWNFYVGPSLNSVGLIGFIAIILIIVIGCIWMMGRR